MIEIPEQVRLAVAGHGLLQPRDSLLAAVSGGLDSMVLLHILHGLAQAERWNLSVAHFNHQLRGRSSDADERLVQRTANRLGLRFRAGRADVRAMAAREGISVEMAARQCRHRFLARTAAALGCDKVALAHHADDQVELFFLRLLRGAGPEGLTGMKWASPSPSNPTIRLIRPLLTLARADLEAFAAREGVKFRPDASNDQLDHERNRLRHKLLPLLRAEYQPALETTVLRAMNILATESDFLAQSVRAAREDSSVAFETLHAAIQRRWLRDECLRLGVEPHFQLVERLRQFPDQEWAVSPNLILCRDRAGHLHSRGLSSSEFRPECQAVDLSQRTGRVEFAGLTVNWRIRPWPGGAAARRSLGSQCETFDADTVGAAIALRHWRAGDRFQPIGMKTAVKLQDLFTNQKVPRLRRRQLAVAATATGEIFWIEGLRISERFKIHTGTVRSLEWRWQRE